MRLTTTGFRALTLAMLYLSLGVQASASTLRMPPGTAEDRPTAIQSAQTAFLPLALWGELPPPPVVQDCRDFGQPCQLHLAPTTAFVTTGTGTGAMPLWAYITNGLGPESGPPLVLTVADNSLAAGAQVTLQPFSQSARGQLWQTSAKGDGSATIWSGLGGAIALGLDLNQPSPVPAVTFPSQIPADAFVTNASQVQSWTYNAASKTIGNKALAGQLNVSGPGANVVLSSASGPGATWSTWPSYPLGAILNQTPVNYPTGTGGEACAYQYISTKLGLADTSCTLGTQPMNGLRCEYTNLAANLASYQSELSNQSVVPTPPFGTPIADCQSENYPSDEISSDEWNDVMGQLSIELTDAGNVRALYQQVNQFYSEVFIDDGNTLSKLVIDAGLSSTDKAHAAALPFVEGALYTILSAAGPVSSVVGNVMETAVNTAAAAQNSSVTTVYFDEVSDLYGNLVTGFNEIQATLGDEELAILSDWGKLQAVSRLIVSTGPDSLAWPPTAEQYLQLATAGYTAVAMQSLLPVKYGILRTVGQVNGTVSGTPTWPASSPSVTSDGLWAEFVSAQTNGDQLWNKFGIQDQHRDPPSADALGDVFDNGVNPTDFFNAMNGWEGFDSQVTTASGSAPVACNVALVGFRNWTNNPNLVLTVDPVQGVLGGNGDTLVTNNGSTDRGQGTTDAVSTALRPYGSTMVAGAYAASGLEFNISVSDGCATVQSFTLHQENCLDVFTKDTTWIDTIASAPGCQGATYPFGYTVTTQNQHTGGAGDITFGLYPPSAPPPPQAPTISGVVPNSGNPGQASFFVKVFGTFQPGATCSFGPEVMLGPQGCSGGTTTLEAEITIPSNAAVGCQDVTVTNPGGAKTTFACGFTVFEPISSFRPTISSLTPNAGLANQSLAVTISGSNFVAQSTCDFGPAVTVASCVFVDDSTITANLEIPAGATPGAYTVKVTNPGQPLSPATSTFTVLGLPLKVDLVNPFTGLPGQSLALLIYGANFQPSATCSFGSGSGITVNSCTGAPGHESGILIADITIAADAQSGLHSWRTLTVTNPDNQSDTWPFRVRPPGSPIVSQIVPRSGTPGQQLTLSIIGSGFVAPATCGFKGVDPDTGAPIPSGITVSSCTVNSATQITSQITIAPDATIGERQVEVTIPGGNVGLGLFFVDPPR